MPTDLENGIRQCAQEAGASKIGFADLGTLATDVRLGLPVGISIAVSLTPSIITGISGGPTLDYEAEYERVNALLDAVSEKIAAFITDRGYQATPMPALGTNFDRQTLSTTLPHKTSATLAGMGWIGKCALLVTEEFGSAIRLTTVLTDAPLPTANPTDNSRCGDCTICTDVCPGSALTGKTWQSGMSRADLCDAFACAKMARGLSAEQGIKSMLCGRCMVECPWTKSYLEKPI